mgnify:CR=1 FL=1
MKEFNRQGFLGEDFENALKKKIAIIGLCGGGGHIAQQLMHMGFINIVFVDFDTLDVSNLTRMVLAKLEDVGKLKVDIALRRSLEIQPNNLNKGIAQKWQNCISELKDCEFIFSCMDKLYEREQLEMFCRSNNIPMIDIGMNVFKNENESYSIVGQVFLSLPNNLCMRCFDFFNPKNNPDGEYGQAGPKPQVVFSNGILASNAINSFVKLISKSYGHKAPSVYKTYDSDSDNFVCHPLVEILSRRRCNHYDQ